MRRFVSTLILPVLLLTVGCSAQPSLMGSWVLVASDIVEDPPMPASIDGAPVKILTEDRFAFGYQTDDREPWAGGGSYLYDAATGRYVEMVEYHSMAGLVGKRIEFDCHIEGDVWHHEGRLDDADGLMVIRETWMRIRSPE